MKAENQIWLIPNVDSKEDIVYPNDPKVSITVDDEIKQFFRAMDYPRHMIDLEKHLQKNGDKPATNTANRRTMPQVNGITFKPMTKKKQYRLTKRTKLTNAHLPEIMKILIGSWFVWLGEAVNRTHKAANVYLLAVGW